MLEAPQPPNTRLYAKTLVGQQEIQARTLGLSPLLRRALILIDGKRRVNELLPFVHGQDIDALMRQLLEQGCIAEQEDTVPAQARDAKSATAAAGPSASATPGATAALDGLPPPETRSAKDLQMARTFMTNTINTMFPQHSRLTLIEAIHACKTSEALRRVYPDWVQTMATSAIGAKRLPELSRQLLTTL
ncbi:MAG: hypothetical protein A3F78_14765 [Burkholderiales bacterium RIFCSPLOWO2_12_FULL_61_40]|nr:MAG: hypothetical protein A3F78_14765 [Burkholderiales bacterium RIFCSPLOWO2_12_FULL_61_40]